LQGDCLNFASVTAELAYFYALLKNKLCASYILPALSHYFIAPRLSPLATNAVAVGARPANGWTKWRLTPRFLVQNNN
jgi:hypothetical protein